MTRATLLPWLAGAVLACSGSPATTASPTPPTADAGPTVAPITYGACPEGYVSECATITVPLDHARPKGETIDFHFARHPASVQPAKRQVWMLAGGPGQAGYVFGPRIPELAAAMPDADIFVPDHRGTGGSHRLTCPQQDVPRSLGGYSLSPAKAPACLEALKPKGDYDRLGYFTSAQAAADVLDAIARTRAPGEKVYVWGTSYGTHWAHRMLQLAPDALDGVLFDGFIAPDRWSVLDYDRGAEEAGAALAAACDADPSCAGHLGSLAAGGALAKTKAVLAKLAQTPCGPFNREQARTLLSLLLDPWSLRALIFPAVHRLERCSPDDVTALTFMVDTYNALAAKSSNVPYLSSGILSDNISLAELWSTSTEPPKTKAELLAAADAQTFLQGASLPGALIDLRGTWPIAPDDAAKLPLPVKTKAKLLWLGGAFDSHAYPSQAKRIAELYPDAPYVNMPYASHVPTRASPMASDRTHQCGNDIAIRFFEGDGVVDTSCIAGMATPLLEAPDAKFALTYWQTADDWGDGTPKN